MSMTAILAKILLLGVVDSLGVWTAVGLVVAQRWGMLAGLVVGLLALNYAVLSKRAYPLRYLLPGLIPFCLMVVYPITVNMGVAFTNFGTGHRLTKEQVIDHFESRFYLPEDGERFTFQAFRDHEEDFIFLLVSKETGTTYLSAEGILEIVTLEDSRFVFDRGEIVQINGYYRLSRGELFRLLGQLQEIRLERNEEVIRLTSIREFRVYQQRYHYDREQGTLTDLKTGIIYTPIAGAFTSADGERLLPGFVVRIGFQNFLEIINNPHIARPFFRVFRWTFAFAALSVATTFVLGFSLAVLLNDPHLKMRHLYRTILIIPYAIPGFISILIWAGMLNVDFGIVNRILQDLFGTTIPWLHDPLWAKVAVVLVNLWLGFPYMMIICLGALQSIPSELYEAARIDGAGSWQRFRKVTFPLLLISIAPLLVGSFAFNFNNFNVIYLLTGGGPPIPGAMTPAGATDILISYTYNLAFGGVGAQYGFAAAISLIIFAVIATISAINFRFTRRLERISEGL